MFNGKFHYKWPFSIAMLYKLPEGILEVWSQENAVFPIQCPGTNWIDLDPETTYVRAFCRPVKGKPLKQSTHVHINPFF